MMSFDNKHLQLLIEISPDIIIAVDRQGTIIYYNDGARQNLGYSSEEIIGQHVTRIYPSLEEARRVMKTIRESGGRISSFETMFRSKSGELIPVAISGSKIHDEHGAEIGSIGYARDIRRMRLREQLATAGEIAVSLAHEINNPLETVTNNLELLTRSLEAHLDQAAFAADRERLDSIRAAIHRVQLILQRLDAISRKGTYQTRDYLQGKKMTDLGPSEPPANEPPAPHDSPQPRGDWPLRGMSVLVLDDDVSVVNSLADLLKAEQCIVHTATLPSAALGLLRNMKIDAVISDVVMPEMDGYQFYTRVKEELPDLTVILMTAYYYDRDHIIKRSRMQGLEGAIFNKPINPAKLRQLLAQCRRQT
jgi:PAS domain S-box-containing protein